MPASTPAYMQGGSRIGRARAEQKARDANRKPAELLVLSGVKPGDRVIEFASVGQYFTDLLSDIVGSKGMVYMYDLPYTDARAGAATPRFRRRPSERPP